ncbi:MAG: DUF721 domain-containing protein [Candidatus Kerfeldbacteria bacterium]|nr:DUF721 domain-containing protein [Candidatus Kerfeldbacteria bacterium]
MWRRISDVLREHGHRAPWRANVEAAQILEQTKKVLGRELPSCADKLHPIHVRDGAITILAEHPAYAQEVRLRERTILEQIKKSNRSVRRITLRVGSATPESSG